MKWFTKTHIAELGYTFLLLAIFSLGYFLGYCDGNLDRVTTSYLVPVILIIKIAAVGITRNTIPSKKDDETTN